MTAAERTLVRAGRDRVVRRRVEQETLETGAPDCEFCGATIENRKPAKRFCSDGCRRRWWDYHTPRGQQIRATKKRSYNARRREAA